MDRGGGVKTIHLVMAERGAEQFLSGITEFQPGKSLPWHLHNCEESVIILEGHALFEANTERHELTANDTTWAQAGVPHRFSNLGPGVLRIYWVYGSTDATRTLVETGETFAIGSDAERRGGT